MIWVLEVTFDYDAKSTKQVKVTSDSLQPRGLYSPWNFQARIRQWVTILFSRGSSWPRNQTRISCIAGRFFISWATREAQKHKEKSKNRQVGLNQTKKLLHSKGNKTVKRQVIEWEEIFSNHISDKGLIYNIINFYK